MIIVLDLCFIKMFTVSSRDRSGDNGYKATSLVFCILPSIIQNCRDFFVSFNASRILPQNISLVGHVLFFICLSKQKLNSNLYGKSKTFNFYYCYARYRSAIIVKPTCVKNNLPILLNTFCYNLFCIDIYLTTNFET